MLHDKYLNCTYHKIRLKCVFSYKTLLSDPRSRANIDSWDMINFSFVDASKEMLHIKYLGIVVSQNNT
jgi:hypothetical protein